METKEKEETDYRFELGLDKKEYRSENGKELKLSGDEFWFQCTQSKRMRFVSRGGGMAPDNFCRLFWMVSDKELVKKLENQGYNALILIERYEDNGITMTYFLPIQEHCMYLNQTQFDYRNQQHTIVWSTFREYEVDTPDVEEPKRNSVLSFPLYNKIQYRVPEWVTLYSFTSFNDWLAICGRGYEIVEKAIKSKAAEAHLPNSIYGDIKEERSQVAYENMHSYITYRVNLDYRGYVTVSFNSMCMCCGDAATLVYIASKKQNWEAAKKETEQSSENKMQRTMEKCLVQ